MGGGIKGEGSQPLISIGMSTSAEQAENNSRSCAVEAFSFQLRTAERELKVSLLGALVVRLGREALLSMTCGESASKGSSSGV